MRTKFYICNLNQIDVPKNFYQKSDVILPLIISICFHQNLQTMQDLENMRKEQIEELESTRSNLDELQNKLTEVRVIRYIIY